MGKRGPKPRLSEDQILEAATGLVLDDGLGGLTMSALARRLDTVVSGLYRYFDSLEAVFVALQVRAIACYESSLAKAGTDIDRALQKAPAKSEAQAALIRVLAVFGRYLRMASTHPAEQALVDAFLSVPVPILHDAFAKQMNDEIEKIVLVCESVLDHAVAAKAISPGDNRQRSYVLWAGLHGLEHFRKRDRIQPKTLKVRALEPALMQNLLIGIGAKSADVEAALAYTVKRRR